VEDDLTKKAKVKAKLALKPGSFVYHGGMVFEIDNAGKSTPRKELGPGYNGNFKHKFYK
jgi:hypothetical protein